MASFFIIGEKKTRPGVDLRLRLPGYFSVIWITLSPAVSAMVYEPGVPPVPRRVFHHRREKDPPRRVSPL